MKRIAFVLVINGVAVHSFTRLKGDRGHATRRRRKTPRRPLGVAAGFEFDDDLWRVLEDAALIAEFPPPV